MSCWLENDCNHRDCDKEFCLRKYKLDYLFDAACLSNTQRIKQTLMVDADKTDLSEFQRLSEIEKNIESYVSQGCNLFLHSHQCGNGKTSWAIRLIQSYFNKIWPKTELKCRALFIDVPTFLIALKDNISEKSEYISYIKENISEADLVVWDDIGHKLGTEFELNHLLSLINSRIMAGKSNVYTSNLNQKEMFNSVGERLTSRITNYSEEIELHGKDKRKISQGGIN